MKVLHLTPHFGGGVGRALSGLINIEGIDHTFVCLEKAEKDFFIRQIQHAGHKVVVQPAIDDLATLIEQSDLVQLEWWRHPATIACLTRLGNISMRLVVWCHVSGLFNEKIPISLIQQSTRFIFTSACSLKADMIEQLSDEDKQKLSVINSNGGLDNWPYSAACKDLQPISVGYLGSFNFSKLHPDVVSFLASVDLNPFQITMIGDAFNAEELKAEAVAKNKPTLLNFTGYSEDVVSDLCKINVLAYIQNPMHYGTNENALLEAMAMGIVPVVLDNPAECEIVKDGETGIIVSDIDGFRKAIAWLSTHPEQRMQMGQKAADEVRQRHATGRMQSLFNAQFVLAMNEPKRQIDFEGIFGEQPADWFLSCQQDKQLFRNDGKVESPQNHYATYSMVENTKGSVLHFHRYFPEDELLQKWAKQVVTLC